MTSTKNDLRKRMMAAMAAAYQEHLDEVAENPVVKKESPNDFFSPYGPAPEGDDSLIDFFARRRASGTKIKETGGLGQ
jgi:hypothetical protein